MTVKALRELRERGKVRFDEESQDPRMMVVALHPFELTELADEIEAEVAERFMELPVDAAGVPIRVGDKLKGCGCDNSPEVTAYAVSNGVFMDVGGYAYAACRFSHVYVCRIEQRTVEDVLADFAADVENDRNTYDTARRYADEIRELLGADD